MLRPIPMTVKTTIHGYECFFYVVLHNSANAQLTSCWLAMVLVSEEATGDR